MCVIFRKGMALTWGRWPEVKVFKLNSYDQNTTRLSA